MQEAAPVAEEGAGPGPSSERASPATNSKVKPDMLDSAGVPVLVVGGLVFGVLNRVLYKVALVPLRDYTYFLSQFNTLAYLAVYFAALGTRRRVGLVTDEMLAIPRARLWLVGALDAVGLLIGENCGREAGDRAAGADNGDTHAASGARRDGGGRQSAGRGAAARRADGHPVAGALRPDAPAEALLAHTVPGSAGGRGRRAHR